MKITRKNNNNRGLPKSNKLIDENLEQCHNLVNVYFIQDFQFLSLVRSLDDVFVYRLVNNFVVV